MGKVKYFSSDLKRVLETNKISTLCEIKASFGTNSDATIFRKLNELSYVRSYSHSGKYYTLPDIAKFDKQGLWAFSSICFSKSGSFIKTVESFIHISEDGYFEKELEKSSLRFR